MKRHIGQSWVVGVLAGLLVLTAAHADASIIVVFQGINDIGSGQFRYDYKVTLTGESAPGANDAEEIDLDNNAAFFTIYDFFGYVAGSQSATGGYSADFAPSSSLLGLTPTIPPSGLPLPAADDPLVPNLTWTYTNATQDIQGQAELGTFSAVSTVNLLATDNFTGQATLTNNQQLAGNIGTTSVPATVPEPGSMFLLGSGLLGLASLARRRSKQART